jgi:hypothetical protein
VPASVRDGTGDALSDIGKAATGQVAAIEEWKKQRDEAAAAEATLAADAAKAAAHQKAAAILAAEATAREIKVRLQKRGDELRRRLPVCQGSEWEKWNACIGELNYSDHEKYSGEFRQGNRQGFGWYTWKSGDTYYGDFDEGLKGNGVYTFVGDGTQLIGGFLAARLHGIGFRVDRAGKLLAGTTWDRGKLVGEELP